MAGFYSDVPAPRMAYDRDGTLLLLTDKVNAPSEVTGATKTSVNDESNGAFSSGNWAVLMFPELRNIAGFLFRHGTATNSGTVETSPDTTNGNDGTWTVRTGAFPMNTVSGTTHRSAIVAVSYNGVKAIRFRANSLGGDQNYYGIHIYGTKADFTGLDTLRIWHPTLDEPLDDNNSADGAYLDWGDVVRGTTGDRAFRIKNNSTTLTANSVNISTEVLTNTTPTLQSQITYSNGGAFAASLNIGNLAPGAISSVITVRRTTSSSATLSVWAWRTIAEAGSWS